MGNAKQLNIQGGNYGTILMTESERELIDKMAEGISRFRVEMEQRMHSTLAMYLETQGIQSNPDQVKHQKGMPLDTIARQFFNSTEQQVLLLQGRGGSGKSTFGKKLALDLWEEWERCRKEEIYKPVPLFIHLPTYSSSLDEVVQKHLKEYNIANQQEVDSFNKLVQKYPFTLILDSYDELPIGVRGNFSIAELLQRLDPNPDSRKHKVWINCRTDYLSDQKPELLFAPPSGENHLDLRWIQPVDIHNEGQVEQYVSKYIAQKGEEISSNYSDQQWLNSASYMSAFRSIPQLREIITTPFALNVTVTVLPKVIEEKRQNPSLLITRTSLYKEYVRLHFDREWTKISPQEHKKLTTAFNIKKTNYSQEFKKAAQKIAAYMFSKGRVNQLICEQEELFAKKPFQCDLESDLEDQRGYYLIRGCPVHLNLKEGEEGERMTQISFLHDTLRDYFLAQQHYETLMKEMRGAHA